jgi:hypothetical protein
MVLAIMAFSSSCFTGIKTSFHFIHPVMTSFDLEISVCQGIVSSFEPYFKVLVILWPCNVSYKLRKYRMVSYSLKRGISCSSILMV